MSKSLFIAGTGTEAGKTYVSALIVKALRETGLNAGYYKPVLSGNVRNPDGTFANDATYAARTAGLPDSGVLVSYAYAAAVSPHLAARLEGHPPELAIIQRDYQKLCARFAYLLVEGSGGIVCPLRYDEQKIFMEDVIRKLGLSVLLVAGCALGTLNATVLTVEYLRTRRLPLQGIICNQYRGGVMEDDNIAMLQDLTGTPVIAAVKPNQTALAADALIPLFT